MKDYMTHLCNFLVTVQTRRLFPSCDVTGKPNNPPFRNHQTLTIYPYLTSKLSTKAAYFAVASGWERPDFAFQAFHLNWAFTSNMPGFGCKQLPSNACL